MNQQVDCWVELDPILWRLYEIAPVRCDCNGAPCPRHLISASISLAERCHNNRNLCPSLGLQAPKIENWLWTLQPILRCSRGVEWDGKKWIPTKLFYSQWTERTVQKPRRIQIEVGGSRCNGRRHVFFYSTQRVTAVKWSLIGVGSLGTQYLLDSRSPPLPLCFLSLRGLMTAWWCLDSNVSNPPSPHAHTFESCAYENCLRNAILFRENWKT